MKIPIYPKDFEDFSTGVNISNEEINQWIVDGFKYLESNPDAQFYNNSTGNASITIFREMFGEFSINVTKDYMENWITI